MPSHVAARLAQHEQSRSLVLFRSAEPAQHAVVLPFLAAGLALVEVGCRGRGTKSVYVSHALRTVRTYLAPWA